MRNDLCAPYVGRPSCGTPWLLDASRLAQGNSVLFRVALALLKLHERALLRCDDQGELLAMINSAARTAVDAERVLALAFSRRLLGDDFSPEGLDRWRAEVLPAVQAEGAGSGVLASAGLGVVSDVPLLTPSGAARRERPQLADTKVAHRRAVAAAATVRVALTAQRGADEAEAEAARRHGQASPAWAREADRGPPSPAFTYVAIGRKYAPADASASSGEQRARGARAARRSASPPRAARPGSAPATPGPDSRAGVVLRGTPSKHLASLVAMAKQPHGRSATASTHLASPASLLRGVASASELEHVTGVVGGEFELVNAAVSRR
mmetsp:Transcript_15766/g.40800  ORF Transcript_15766/g.40800 Transcript_15766/m.40800 type:complete len:324 (-) Transcript_15766:74-1045(-)